jgi:cellulose biosynthesis protein BcsQ
MKILAITSGKGGVGKSTFSLNIARQLSLAGKKTLLVDFDIHNKGITSLFLAKLGSESPECAPTSVTDIVASSSDFREIFLRERVSSLKLVPITPDGMLYLIPASLPKQLIQWTRFHAENEHIVAYFSAFFNAAAEQYSFDSIVIDCYGGIDSMTVAAAGIANDTVIVNEPDLITFTGTILLYKYLLDQYRQADKTPKVHFLINRVPSRYTFKFLSQAYSQNLAEYSVDKQVLAYFPYDKLIIETFGDYPFFSEILPRSLFTRKIRLLIEMLWKEDPGYARFSGLRRKRKTKIFEQTSEYFFAEPDRIIRTFVRAPFFLIIPTLFLFLLTRGVGGTLDYRTILAVVFMSWAMVATLILFIGFFEPLQISKWLLREARYHRRKRILKRAGSIPSRVSSTVFEFGQAILPLLFGCIFLGALGFYVGNLTITSHLFAAHGQYKLLGIWPGEISGLKPNADYSGMVLHSGATLRPGTNLHGSKFVGSSFPRVKFKNIDLSGADFSGAYLLSCEFYDSNLVNAKFGNSSLQYAHFRGSTASGANFKRAYLLNTEFDNINLTQARFWGAFLSHSTKYQSDLKRLGAVFEPSAEDIASMSPDELATFLEEQIVLIDPKLQPEIEQELALLDRMATHDNIRNGYFLLLRLENQTARGIEDPRATSEWRDHLKANGGILFNWSWLFWNNSLDKKRLSHSALRKLDLIQQSATGKISPETFFDEFTKVGAAEKGLIPH